MEYRRKQMNNLLITAILMSLLAIIVVGQQKENKGFLFGHVGIDDPQKEYWIPLPNALVEIQHKNKVKKKLLMKQMITPIFNS